MEKVPLTSWSPNEVHLIAVRAIHRVLNLRRLAAVQDALLEVFKSSVAIALQRLLVEDCVRPTNNLTAVGDIQVIARTTTIHHAIDNVLHLDAVVVRVTHIARVGQAGTQSLERFDEAEVSLDGALDGHAVRVHQAVVHRVIERLVVVVVLERGAVLHTRVIDRIAVNLVGHVARILHHVEVVLLVAAARVRRLVHIFLGVVATDRKRGLNILADVGRDAGAVVPAVVVQLADVTILRLVGDASKVSGFLCTAVHVDAMAL